MKAYLALVVAISEWMKIISNLFGLVSESLRSLDKAYVSGTTSINSDSEGTATLLQLSDIGKFVWEETLFEDHLSGLKGKSSQGTKG